MKTNRNVRPYPVNMNVTNKTAKGSLWISGSWESVLRRQTCTYIIVFTNVRNLFFKLHCVVLVCIFKSLYRLRWRICAFSKKSIQFRSCTTACACPYNKLTEYIFVCVVVYTRYITSFSSQPQFQIKSNFNFNVLYKLICIIDISQCFTMLTHPFNIMHVLPRRWL